MQTIGSFTAALSGDRSPQTPVQGQCSFYELFSQLDSHL